MIIIKLINDNYVSPRLISLSLSLFLNEFMGCFVFTQANSIAKESFD